MYVCAPVCLVLEEFRGQGIRFPGMGVTELGWKEQPQILSTLKKKKVLRIEPKASNNLALRQNIPNSD